MNKAESAQVKPSDTKAIKIHKTMTIMAPLSQLYAAWRDSSNFPNLMSQAKITQNVPNESLHWRSADNADLPYAGSVFFRRAPAERGTEVTVTWSCDASEGKAGTALAKLWGEDPGQQIFEDLRRFKQLMEAGEISTNAMRPADSEKTLQGSVPGRTL